jgi:hypothetical protein
MGSRKNEMNLQHRVFLGVREDCLGRDIVVLRALDNMRAQL